MKNTIYTEKMFDTFNLAFTNKATLSYIMKIKSRFISKRGVLLDLKISDFGWKRGLFLIQNSEEWLFSKLGYEELLNISFQNYGSIHQGPVS